MLRTHVVVDGSNIATEARTTPSLTQLDEAVRAFLEEHPSEQATVIVDATFGHRIPDAERDAFEDAANAGELLTAPAGTIGRGDAFVLQVADKADATVLSNDSFQEFHGQYPWLFDEGRLIGGKPVPGVGWVFLLRSPVRGPISRRAVKDARQSGTKRPAKRASGRAPMQKAASKKAATKKASSQKASSQKPASKKAASQKAAPKKAGAKRRSGRGAARKAVSEKAIEFDDPATAAAIELAASDDGTGARNRARKPLEPLNPPLPFIEFVGAHPVGSTVHGTVERFSSHGAYVSASGAQCYVPLKLMGTPSPKSAKEILRVGESRDFVVFAIDAPRRGIDLALRGFDTTPQIDSNMRADQQEQRNKSRKRAGTRGSRAESRRARKQKHATQSAERAVRASEPKTSKTHTLVSVLATTTRADQLAEEAPVTPARKKRTAKKAAKRSPARRRKAGAKRPAKKRAAKKRSAAKRPAKKRATKKRATKKRAAKRPAKKRATKRRATKKRAAKKRPAKKRATKRRATKKRAAKKRPAKKRAPKRPAKKRAPKRPAKKRAAKRTTKRRARRRR